MQQKRSNIKEMEPFVQLMVLFGYAISGAVVFGVLAIAIVVALFGTGMFQDILSGVPTARSADSFKILLLVSTSIGTFLVPALALAWTEKIPVKTFYDFKKSRSISYIYVVLLALVSLPIMEWIILLNEGMQLPAYLKSIEDWMRRSEEAAMQTTYTLLTFRNWWDLPANLIVVAVAPAIAEEFMFRGGLQRGLGRMMSNPHVVIWTSAIIFSAIHMQFFGFLPRMLMGAAFGYIYFWTKNLWIPIFAHFVNNGFAVVVAWNLSRQNIPLDSESMVLELHWSMYILSLLATIVILYLFKKQANNEGRTVGSDLQNG